MRIIKHYFFDLKKLFSFEISRHLNLTKKSESRTQEVRKKAQS